MVQVDPMESEPLARAPTVGKEDLSRLIRSADTHHFKARVQKVTDEV
jgi:hypothetical protein